MGIELPPISAKIIGDLSGLRSMVAEAKQAAQQVNRDVQAMQASASPVFLVAQTKAAVKEAAASIRTDIDGAFNGPAAKPRFDTFNQQVREGMAKAIRSMRDAAKEANVNEEVNLRLYGPAQAKSDVVRAEETIAVIKGEASAAAATVAEETGGGFLKGLNSQFGRGSSAGMIGRLITGGGPILAIGLITGALKSATEQAKNLVTQFRAGEIDASETTVKIAESIPILGSVAGAIANIHEIITGNQAALASANKEAAEMISLTARIRDNWRDSADAVKSINAGMDNLRVDRILAAADPMTKELIGIDRKTKATIAEMKKSSDEAIQKILNPAGGDPMSVLLDKQKDLNKKIADLTRDIPKPIIGPISGQLKNQYEIDEAKKAISALQRQLAPVVLEIGSRNDAAAGPIAAAPKALDYVRRTGGQDTVNALLKAAIDENKRLWASLKDGPTSPFNALNEMVREARSAARSGGQQFDILRGRYDHQDVTEAMMKARRVAQMITGRVDTSGMSDYRDLIGMGADNAASLHDRLFGRSGKDDSSLIQHLFSSMSKFTSGRVDDKAGSGSKAAEDAATNTKDTVEILKSIDRKLDFEVVTF